MTTPLDAELPPIDDEAQQFLHYNPNTADLVEWVRNYARAAIAMDRAAREKPNLKDDEEFAAAWARGEPLESRCGAHLLPAEYHQLPQQPSMGDTAEAPAQAPAL